MSSMLYRPGRTAAQHRVLVLMVWLVNLGLIGGGALVFNRGTDDRFAMARSRRPLATVLITDRRRFLTRRQLRQW